jgi:cytochrome c oxidase subunit 2
VRVEQARFYSLKGASGRATRAPEAFAFVGEGVLIEDKGPPVSVDRNFWLVTLLLTVLAIAAIWFWVTAPITTWLPAAVDKADQIDALFRFLAASGTALFVFVAGYLLYFSLAFRRRPTDLPDAVGVQVHDNHTLELWWVILPALFVLVMAIYSVKIWYGIEVAQAASSGMTVQSIGHQWYYTFRYPGVNGEITDQVHLPLGVPITLEVTSTDVIHSFWVPAMRLKADMVPGLINTIRFTPNYAGTYKIICTEFCGTNHSTMEKQVVVIEDRAAFNKWYAGWQVKNKNVSNALPAPGSGGALNLAGGDAAAGKQLFATKCSACHALGPYSQKLVGPGLRDVLHDPGHPSLVDGSPANPADVAKILQTGYTGDMGHMPNQTQNSISDKDIANLVAYLNSLK